MSTPFLSEIKITSFNFPPKGWAMCNGQLLPINQNQALFSLLGTTYGGDGRQTFALPDLRSRIPVGSGNSFTLGEKGGEEAHTLNLNELPAHSHPAQCSSAAGTTRTAAAARFAAESAGVTMPFGTTADSTLNAGSVLNVGGSQPHTNLQPYLVLNFIIALQGIFPSSN